MEAPGRATGAPAPGRLILPGAMSPAPVALPSSLPVAEIERRLQWRALPMVVFGVILVGLAVVAVASQFEVPRTQSGLPDDASLGAASSLVEGRTLAETGEFRWTSALLGDGATPVAFAPIEQLRAERAAEHVSHAMARRPGDARVLAAGAALALVRNDWRGAERGYRAALDRNPHYGEARLGLGVTLARRARIEPAPFRPRALQLAAIAQFAAVRAKDPVYPQALWNRAVLLTEVGRRDEARTIARRFLVLESRGPWAEALAERVPAGR